LAVGAALASGLAGGVASAGHRPRDAVRSYVVRPGDTVWAIAARLAGPTADPRPLVDAIVSLNGSDGTLIPGRTLLLPRAG
jgi:Tfp pilus assembly protein FimV